MSYVINAGVATLRWNGGNDAPEYMATIIPECLATIPPEWVAMFAGMRTARVFLRSTRLRRQPG